MATFSPAKKASPKSSIKNAVAPHPHHKFVTSTLAQPADTLGQAYGLGHHLNNDSHGAEVAFRTTVHPVSPAPVIQAKLQVGSANDPLEQEADQLAEKVLRMPSPASSGTVSTRKSAIRKAGKRSVQRKCTNCQDEEKGTIQLKPLSSNHQLKNIEKPSLIRSAVRHGQSLSTTEKNFFEPRFGYDFNEVRLHTHSDAARSADKLQARAYTLGNNIVFNRNEYNPGSPQTQSLLAHELTHVIQQSGRQASPMIQRTTTRGAGGCGPPKDIDEDLNGARAAGRTAHTQIQTFLLKSGIANELIIPRATKTDMSQSCPPESRNEGRADLWKPGNIIGIAEIKPFGFATHTGRAREEADHYIHRGKQSMDRTHGTGAGPGRCGHQPPGKTDDPDFARRIGTGSFTGRRRFTRLRGILSSDTLIGSFVGDRSRNLKARMTEPGSVGYWCTGGSSKTYPCDATGKQTEEYIDSVLMNVQDALDDFLKERFEKPLEKRLSKFSTRDLLKMGKQVAWPQIRDALKKHLGVLGYVVPDDISLDKLADIIDSQIGPAARTIILTVLRQFKSLVLNELRRLLRDMLRTLIRQALTALCVGVPVVTLATLLEKLKKMFEEQAKLLIPVAINAALAKIAIEIMKAIGEVLKKIGNFVLRILATLAIVVLVIGALVLAVIAILALLDPVPGDELIPAWASGALLSLAAALLVFVTTGELPEDEGNET